MKQLMYKSKLKQKLKWKVRVITYPLMNKSVFMYIRTKAIIGLYWDNKQMRSAESYLQNDHDY